MQVSKKVLVLISIWWIGSILSNSFEANIGEHLQLIYTILTKTFAKTKPKFVHNWKYKDLNFESINVSLGNALESFLTNFDSFNLTFISILDYYTS